MRVKVKDLIAALNDLPKAKTHFARHYTILVHDYEYQNRMAHCIRSGELFVPQIKEIKVFKSEDAREWIIDI